MCGRFTLTTTIEKILTHLQLPFAENFDYKPRYNIAPTQQVLSVIGSDLGKTLTYFKWGLIPTWAKDQSIGSRMINARSETLNEKPSFKPLISYNRCAIIADGFYEWKTTQHGKQPYRILRHDQNPFAFAGLWTTWQSPDGEKIRSCTIITTKANSLVEQVHDRMPVILTAKSLDLWLDTSLNRFLDLEEVLIPYPADQLTMYPVSKLVNSPKNDTIDCIKPDHLA
ncbi:MAG: SOS response-associated peptidase [Firmicutes bacterium]|nr:SOS response-associated peptidase [Bacillota bacterium]